MIIGCDVSGASAEGGFQSLQTVEDGCEAEPTSWLAQHARWQAQQLLDYFCGNLLVHHPMLQYSHSEDALDRPAEHPDVHSLHGLRAAIAAEDLSKGEELALLALDLPQAQALRAQH
jgi:hypothetical protein